MKLKSYKEIIPYQQNPKNHPDEQLLKLAKLINQFGWVFPWLIDKDKNLVSGHGRLQVMEIYREEYKFKPPWVMCQGITVLGEPDKRPITNKEYQLFRIADNKVAESSWDFPMLKDEILDLDTGEFPITDTCFDLPEIENMMTIFGDEYEPYKDINGKNDSLNGFDEIYISVLIPSKYEAAIKKYLSNGETETPAGMGKGLLKRCELL